MSSQVQAGISQTLTTPKASQIGTIIFVVVIKNCSVQRHFIHRYFNEFPFEKGLSVYVLPATDLMLHGARIIFCSDHNSQWATVHSSRALQEPDPNVNVL